MSNDPGMDMLNGRSTGDTQLGGGLVVHNDQVLPWRPVELYRKVKAAGDRLVARNRGSLGAAGKGGPQAGVPWDTPSTLDQITALAEILTVVYTDPAGKDHTLSDMIIELYQDLQARKSGTP